MKTLRHYNRKTSRVECKNKDDTSNNGGNWNNLKIFQKARNQGTSENSHIRHCIHTSESTKVRVQNIQRWK